MNYIPLSKLYYSDSAHYDGIYQQRINSESTYHFAFKINENPAFIVFTPELFGLMAQILELNMQINLLARDLPDPALNQYSKKCLIDEILLTNDIEGVVSTRNEINETLEEAWSLDSKKRKRFHGLVQKYTLLLKDTEIPLKNCQDIRNLYNDFILNEIIEENPKNIPDGLYFRQGHVNVLSKSRKVIHEGLFPETAIITTMEQGLDLLNDASYNFLMRIAIFHYLFAYIHPFYDGNGRMTRFISSYMLSRKLHPLTGFRLSYTVKKNIDKYYKSFKITNDPKNKGDLTPFVINFFEILVFLVEDLYKSLEKRSNQMNHYFGSVKKYASEMSKEAILLRGLIINTLFGEEGLSIEELIYISELGNSKVRSFISTLQKEDLIKIKKDGRKYLYDIDLSKL